MEDSRGFIWIGTWDGLNKYDGYDFIVYNTTNGLSNPTINSLIEDEEKNIWIATDEGLNLLDRNSGKIELLLHRNDRTTSLKNNQITHLFQDSKGYIWISTANGLSRYDKNQKSFTCFNFYERDADSSFTNYVSRVKEDGTGRIWIATHRGIHCFDPSDNSFKEFRMDTMVQASENRKSNYIQDLIIDKDNRIYAATLNGVFVIDPGSSAFQNIFPEDVKQNHLSGKQVNALLLDKKGQLWIGTSQGLDVYDPATKSFSCYKSGGNITNLSNEDIRCLYQDRSGTIWIGTYKGLNKVDMSPSRFAHIRHEPDNPNSLADNIVYSILEDDESKLWIATYGGVNILDRNSEKFSLLISDPKDPQSLSSNKIRTISLDSSGYIWVGTESDGINRIDRKTGKIKRYYNDPGDASSIAENNILTCYVDSKGRIWIGTVSKGVSIFNPADGSMQLLSSGRLSRARLSDNRIWSIFEDRDGYFWLGTSHGLNRISPDLQNAEVYLNDPANPNSISNNRILSIFQDEEGIFWIGTIGGGLNRFDPVSGLFKIYTEHNGLPNNVIYSTLEDDSGNLWITSNRGISKFSKQSETFVNYDTKDGVQGNEFNAGAYFKNSQGEMFFGGMNGINIFHPEEITRNMVPPKMVFTGVWVLNDLQAIDIENGEILRLRYNENFFSIEFSALDFTNPSKNLYKYKLENYDQEWVIAGADNRKADYRKVDPGSYRFIVTGSNNDGVWNQEGISLTVIIRPPWWKNWIFRLSIFLVMVALLWSVIILRIRTIRRKHSVEKKMLAIEKQVFELEQKALRLQMNPHFIFNSLNAIQNFVLANDTDKAVNYLAKFSHLMRMILANSTASLITLKDEMKALTYYIDLEKLRFDDRFDYAIFRDPAIDEEFVEIPPMLFQPYVENAIIHGLVNSPNRGRLEIAIRLINSATLLCSIKDNGIGREKAIEIRNRSGIKRQPKGMMITQERIEIFNRQNRKNFSVKITDLKDDEGKPSGTLVEFTIQYKET
jgi:ligand-binding sensor domain-containing protein